MMTMVMLILMLMLSLSSLIMMMMKMMNVVLLALVMFVIVIMATMIVHDDKCEKTQQNALFSATCAYQSNCWRCMIVCEDTPKDEEADSRRTARRRRLTINRWSRQISPWESCKHPLRDRAEIRLTRLPERVIEHNQEFVRTPKWCWWCLSWTSSSCPRRGWWTWWCQRSWWCRC